MIQASIGAVVIGRNEGQRLRACLSSLTGVEARVYVDSGSTDGSQSVARGLGFEVIELDLANGFTAARARNAGIEWLACHYPDLELVQTIDGDCVMRDGWLEVARSDLNADSRRAVVFGRRRERRPRRNIYHLACDDEWNVITGEVNSCGGDALFRLDALREISGYNGSLIAGEEPDLCLRLREHGWRIWSNGREMTWHDVGMDNLEQWWNRSRRTGFAIAELVSIHASRADPSWRRLLRSALLWTAVNIFAPFAAMASVLVPAWLSKGILLAPLALALIQLARLARSKWDVFGAASSIKWAVLLTVAKAAQALGWAQFKSQRVTRKRAALIEYKAGPRPAE